MSVYGGFATRRIESTYNMAVYNLISLLQYRVQRLYQEEEGKEQRKEADDQHFKRLLARQYTLVYKLDVDKHLLPKFSYAMKELAKSLGIFEQTASDLRFKEHPLAPKPKEHPSPRHVEDRSRPHSQRSGQGSARSKSR